MGLPGAAHTGQGRKAVYAAVLAVLLSGSACLVAVLRERYIEGFGTANSAHLYAFWGVVGAVVFAVLFAVALRRREIIVWLDRLQTPRDFMPLTFDLRGVVRAMVLVFVLWLPWTVAAYPAFMDWDTMHQIFQTATDAPVYYGARAVDVVIDAKYIDHDPLFDTLLYGLFWKLGIALGNQSLGWAAYSLLQCLLFAFSLVFALCYAGDRAKAPHALLLALLLFIALFPPFPRFAMTMLKDSTHAPFFLLYFVAFLEVYATRGQGGLHSKWFVALVLLGCMCILTKKTGFIEVALSSVALTAASKGFRVRALAGGIVPIVVILGLLPVVVFPVINVAPGGKQEGLGMMFEQTAAVVDAFPEDVSDGERQAIEGVLPFDQLASAYESEREDDLYPGELIRIDPVKNLYKWDATGQDRRSYLAAYLQQGIRHPWVYARTILLVNGGLYAPVRAVDMPHSLLESALGVMQKWEGEADVDLSRPPVLVKASALLDAGYRKVLVTLAGPFLQTGFYGGWVPVLACAALLYRRKGSVLALAPVIAAFLCLFLSPIVFARYALPLMFAFPVLVLVGLCPQLLDDAVERSESDTIRVSPSGASR